jgi:hypothetical protein
MWIASQTLEPDVEPDEDAAHDILQAESAGHHALAAKVAFSAVAWFLAVFWLKVSAGIATNPVVALVTGFFVMLLTFVLVTLSPAARP